MVELVVWLLHSYYANLDSAKEMVFTKVHFTLFYTAIFNAIQTTFVAFFSMRVSRHLWIQTETLELNHYVEIREEFQRVKDQLQKLMDLPDHSTKGDVWTTATTANTEQAKRTSTSLMTDPFLPWDRQTIGRTVRQAYCHIRHPHLQRRYNQLLAQVRFHELRVHLLQACRLPMKLKVSDYLIRCELAVLVKLVHISIVAWLLLTGVSNLMYFVMGIVAYEREDAGVIGTSLEYLFFISEGGFVLMALALDAKMNRIFGILMHQPILWNMDQGEEERRQLSVQQMQLFWLGNPKVVIALIQFMQFGYAVALSVVLIFWDLIQSGDIAMRWYVIAIIITYSIFLFIVAKIIPRYTLCTCLGQLIDHRRLHETVSIFRLEEAKRKQLEHIAMMVDISALPAKESKTDNAPEVAKGPLAMKKKPVPSAAFPKDKSTSDLWADLVKLDTSALRSNLPEPEKDALTRRERRRDRRRSTSDGVNVMANAKRIGTISLSDDSNVASDLVQSNPGVADGSSDTRSERRRNRIKSLSDGVAFMASLNSVDGTFDDIRLARSGLAKAYRRGVPPRTSTPVDSALVISDTNSLRTMLPDSERHVLELREARKRCRRVKSSSEGVQKMVALASSMGRSISRASSSRSIAEGSSIPYDTHDLQDSLSPGDTLPENLMARRRSRGTRRKSVSDGVALMASVAEVPREINLKRSGFLKEASAKLPLQQSSSNGESLAFRGMSGKISEGEGADSSPLDEDRTVSESKLNPDFITTLKTGANGLIRDTLPFNGTPAKKDVNDEDTSVNGTVSLGDNSDDGSVPNIDPTYLLQLGLSHEKLTYRVRLKKYYLSKRFVLVSNVFGTMVAFFFIGQRVESFLTTQGLTDTSKFVSFDFPSNVTFWCLFTWFLLFFVTSALIFMTLGRYSALSCDKEKAIFLSAVLDVLLTGFCLAMLCAAEAQRCCHPVQNYETNQTDAASNHSASRYLADTTATDDYDGEYHFEPPPCSCPTFGSRHYGGLGDIEPFTSMIALRILRFWAGRLLLRFFGAETVPNEASNQAEQEHVDPFAVYNDTHHDHHKHMTHEKGTIIELWQTAVEKYPGIVSEYGEFSGELLQAMLGVPRFEHSTIKDVQQIGFSDAKAGSTSTFSSQPLSNRRLSLEKQYSTLTPHAQEVIMAGRLGRAVKSMMDIRISEEDEYSLLGEERFGKLHFEIDLERANSVDEESFFSAPNARLIRSMRRGDRKLLPILNNWSVVDIVMTRFEMVYFDATVADDSGAAQAVDDTREAIVATRGGKGLRLCDVAVGRRVVGHLDFSDIESVVVERDLPHAVASGELDPPFFVSKVEYWQDRDFDDSATPQSRWSNTKQDSLKIQTTSGHTLLIRFYSDLADAEAHADRVDAEDELQGPIFKNNALQWAQTLIRFCGPEQLKQSLPNYGKDSNDELRDFLLVKNPERKGATHRRGASAESVFWHQLPRMLSTANVASSPVPAKETPRPRKPGPLRRASSTFDGTTPQRQKPSLHRASSMSGSYLLSSGGEARRLSNLSRSLSHVSDLGQRTGGLPTEQNGDATTAKRDDMAPSPRSVNGVGAAGPQLVTTGSRLPGLATFHEDEEVASASAMSSMGAPFKLSPQNDSPK